MSYLVMECHPGYAILLDEEGRFVKAANLCYEEGQTVQNPVLMKKVPEKKRRFVRRISSGAAAAAACFLLLSGISWYRNYMEPYSSIYLTINPEVRMDLNRQGTVVELEGMNGDGARLLEGYDGRGKDKVTVSNELTDRAIEMGFLSEGGQVSFSIESPDDVLFQKYGTELRTMVTEHLNGQITVTIEIVSHGEAENGQTPQNTPVPSAVPSVSAPPVQTEIVTLPPDAASDYGSEEEGDSGYTLPAVTEAPSSDSGYTPADEGNDDDAAEETYDAGYDDDDEDGGDDNDEEDEEAEGDSGYETEDD